MMCWPMPKPPTSPTAFDHGTRGKRPRFRVGDRVTLASHVRPIPAYSGKPFVGREDVLRVSSVTGRGTLRDPWGVSVTDDQGHFWGLLPGDLVLAEEASRHHSTIRGEGESFASVYGKAVRENLRAELGRALAEIQRATHSADYRGKIHAYGTEAEMHRFAEGLRDVKVRPITERERKDLTLRKRQAYRNP